MSVEENLWLQIEKLREQINANPDERKWDEANTCSVLIDPLLRELGWATDDLSQVKRQHPVGRGKVDYALFKDGEQKPAVLIEAKRLSDPVRSGPLGGMPETGNSSKTLRLRDAAIQGIGYCLAAEVQYLAVTDGRRWYIYDACEKGFMDEKLKTSFDLMAESAIDKCLRATVLWRQGVNLVDKGREPGKKPPVQTPKNQTREFVHGMRVDAAGYVLTKSGKRHKGYGGRPRGTKWVVDGHSLDAAGRLLDSNGKRDKQYEQPYPPNTMYIVDRRPLDKDRWVLTFDGKRDQDFKIPCPDETKQIVDGLFLDAYRWRLTKDGEQNKSFKQPYPLGGKRSAGSKRAKRRYPSVAELAKNRSEGAKRNRVMGRRRRGGP